MQHRMLHHVKFLQHDVLLQLPSGVVTYRRHGTICTSTTLHGGVVLHIRLDLVETSLPPEG
jgi:hypothetical protein